MFFFFQAEDGIRYRSPSRGLGDVYKRQCETCGTINSNMAKTDYGYGKNVYWLYDCAANFFEDLPESVEIEQVDWEYHRVITTGGQYCGFCYGTYHTEDATLERHHMETSIRPELAHQRFVEMDACTDCGYAKTSLSLIHISEPTRRTPISYAVFCLKKKKKKTT